jgi:hypothetical protein
MDNENDSPFQIPQWTCGSQTRVYQHRLEHVEQVLPSHDNLQQERRKHVSKALYIPKCPAFEGNLTMPDYKHEETTSGHAKQA